MNGTLVLGGTGFLGAHVVAAAYARARAGATYADPDGPPVVGAGRDPWLAPRFADPRDGPRWEAVDLADAGALEALLARLAPAHVVNCAAVSRVAQCEEDPDGAHVLNVDVAAAAACWCRDRGARLVHVSTDLVFGAEDAPPGGFDEGAPVGPVSEYGRTKRDGELAVLEAHPAALVARLPLLYGNSGGRGLGASDGLLEAVERDLEPPLFVDEWRTPLEVQNAAEALVELLHGDVRGVLHVAGPDRVSRHELGLVVLEAMGLSPADASRSVRAARRADVPTVGERPADVSLDARRARGCLDTPLLGVREGTRRAVR